MATYDFGEQSGSGCPPLRKAGSARRQLFAATVRRFPRIASGTGAPFGGLSALRARACGPRWLPGSSVFYGPRHSSGRSPAMTASCGACCRPSIPLGHPREYLGALGDRDVARTARPALFGAARGPKTRHYASACDESSGGAFSSEIICRIGAGPQDQEFSSACMRLLRYVRDRRSRRVFSPAYDPLAVRRQDLGHASGNAVVEPLSAGAVRVLRVPLSGRAARRCVIFRSLLRSHANALAIDAEAEALLDSAGRGLHEPNTCRDAVLWYCTPRSPCARAWGAGHRHRPKPASDASPKLRRRRC